MKDMLIAAATSGGLVVGLFLFFLFYRPIWEATTREPFTNILRRNRYRFSIIIVCGVAAAGGVWAHSVHYRDWSAWPYYTWVVVAMAFIWVFVGHIFWAGLRWGAVHAPTAWRCQHQLTLKAESLEPGPERDGMASAAVELERCLDSLDIPFRGPDRGRERRGLCDV